MELIIELAVYFIAGATVVTFIYAGIVYHLQKRRRITVQEFARLVTQIEGKKKEVDIAQILEILKITKDLILKETGEDIYKLMLKPKKK